MVQCSSAGTCASLCCSFKTWSDLRSSNPSYLSRRFGAAAAPCSSHMVHPKQEQSSGTGPLLQDGGGAGGGLMTGRCQWGCRRLMAQSSSLQQVTELRIYFLCNISKLCHWSEGRTFGAGGVGLRLSDSVPNLIIVTSSEPAEPATSAASLQNHWSCCIMLLQQ